MMFKTICVLVVSQQTVNCLVQPRVLSTACNFSNEPLIPYYWDPSCGQEETSLGCMADGKNLQCRFCGEGDYQEVFCPAAWCNFDNPPHLPYYWDTTCSMGKIGCLADGKNLKCRFCGEYPYNGTVKCPPASITPVNSCRFDNEPETAFFWDSSCEDGMLGCKADGRHIGCRFCGTGDYETVHCPASLCTFEPGLALPSPPYNHYWEPQCWNSSAHILGCLADGIHPQCRYCGGAEYQNISCPAWSWQ